MLRLENVQLTRAMEQKIRKPNEISFELERMEDQLLKMGNHLDQIMELNEGQTKMVLGDFQKLLRNAKRQNFCSVDAQTQTLDSYVLETKRILTSFIPIEEQINRNENSFIISNLLELFPRPIRINSLPSIDYEIEMRDILSKYLSEENNDGLVKFYLHYILSNYSQKEASFRASFFSKIYYETTSLSKIKMIFKMIASPEFGRGNLPETEISIVRIIYLKFKNHILSEWNRQQIHSTVSLNSKISAESILSFVKKEKTLSSTFCRVFRYFIIGLVYDKLQADNWGGIDTSNLHKLIKQLNVKIQDGEDIAWTLNKVENLCHEFEQRPASGAIEKCYKEQIMSKFYPHTHISDIPFELFLECDTEHHFYYKPYLFNLLLPNFKVSPFSRIDLTLEELVYCTLQSLEILDLSYWGEKGKKYVQKVIDSDTSRLFEFIDEQFGPSSISMKLQLLGAKLKYLPLIQETKQSKGDTKQTEKSILSEVRMIINFFGDKRNPEIMKIVQTNKLFGSKLNPIDALLNKERRKSTRLLEEVIPKRKNVSSFSPSLKRVKTINAN